MKLNGNPIEELEVLNKNISAKSEIIGDNHIATGLETPLRPDAFLTSDEDKIRKISHYFKEIMETLGLDLNDDSLQGSPERVAKMYVNEIFSGLNPKNKPSCKLFLTTSLNTTKCLLKRTLLFTHIVSIILYLSSVKPMSHTFQMVK